MPGPVPEPRLHGISTAGIAASTGLAEDLVCQVMSGDAVVTAPAQVEGIADGLNLPVAARAALGLAPRVSESLHMPLGFWARPDMIRALTTWDVPAMLSAILDERRWTQHHLAVVLGYSQSWVSNVLRRDQSLTLGQGREIALKFGAPLHRLTLAPEGPAACYAPRPLPASEGTLASLHAAMPHQRDLDVAAGRFPAVAELCAALTNYEPGRSAPGPGLRDEVPSARDLERDLKIAFDAYQQSRFTIAASQASLLLANVQLAARERTGAEHDRVLAVLALSYQAVASVLTKAGEPDLAWIAAERGFNIAETSYSPAVRGSLLRSVAFALLSTGRLESAMRLVESGADHLRGEISGDDTGLSVYGTLLLVPRSGGCAYTA